VEPHARGTGRGTGYKVARRKASQLPEEKRRIGLEVFEAMEARIAEGLASGALRSASGSAHGSAQALWAAIHGLVALLLAYPEFGWVPLDELIAIHTDMLLHGMIDQRHKSACKPAATAKAIDQPVTARRSSKSKRGGVAELSRRSCLRVTTRSSDLWDAGTGDRSK
jgi:hypothetical protein